MILLIDNYDSFTYNLFQYIRMLGRKTTVLRNDEASVEGVRRLRPEMIVISPGPGGPEATGNCLQLLEELHTEVPFFGVCLGMQTVARFFGGAVTRARAPVHGKVRETLHDGTGLFAGLPNPLRVTRYHSLVVEEASLPTCLEVNARSREGEIMGLRHRRYPICGVQFHPEALLTQGGMDLLRNAMEGARC